jgi:[acyl-carrier-protein] S-malonyltransferase
MARDGVEKAVECGPGKVLCGLVKRIDKSIPTANVADLASLETATAFLA